MQLEHLTRLNGMNVLPVERRAVIVRALLEGSSVRSTARLTATSKATVLKLLVDLGEFCSIYQDHVARNLNTKRVEADEIWSFVGAKQKHATKPGQGDIWTYTALDADSKLMVSWLVGSRNSANTKTFMHDVAERLACRGQLSTDGLGWYLAAVEGAFSWNGVDFSRVIKRYGVPTDVDGQRRYSPMEYTGIQKLRVTGDPDIDLVSTSYVECSNLSMRMGVRRITPLTNRFAQKAENHAHAVSLYFMYYNFCRAHQTLTKANGGIITSPAIAAGLTNHVWTIEDILSLMDPNQLLPSK